ncbi:glutathione S-transferase [Roseomonas sp. BN140053]|uniref:glutathione S-transferase n=1 Tax=Roseomonas sp. BN140053 TaxID=3391898 RepID=UPI0039E75EA8
MKLFYAAASPYVRKVRIVATENGLWDHIEPVTITANPLSRNATLGAANPLAKVPCLVLEDGSALYDSRVICEVLDATGGGTLFPVPGPDRWRALVEQALADGLLDAALLIRYESSTRPEEIRSQPWLDGQMGKILAALDEMERRAADLGGRVDIGTIAMACALGYLDFRFADLGWQHGRAGLAAWFARFAERPSFRDSMPQG